MRFRKLRIVFSAMCGVACLLLIVLWVRSYWHFDQFGKVISSRSYFGGGALQGQCLFSYSSNPKYIAGLKVAGVDGWHKGDVLVEDWIRATPSAQNQPFGSLLIRGFKFGKSDFRVPHWFLVLLSATCAAVTWPKWSRRFTLRSLLITMTVVVVLLVAIIYAIK
jgi:hypothetical protein